MRYLCVMLAVVAVGCGSQTSAPSSPTATSAPAAVVPTGSAHTQSSSDANSCQPTGNIAVFSTEELGRVTVTNASSCTNDYTYIVWLRQGDRRTNVGQASYRLAPGQVGIITVGVPQTCGARYERNLYFGVTSTPGQPPYTPSDVNNAPVYAPGVYWDEPACGPTGPSPLVAMCGPDVNVTASWPHTSAVATFPLPNTLGGVAPILRACSAASGSSFGVGSTPVSCDASDAAGRSASCGLTVTVAPATPPTPSPEGQHLTCPGGPLVDAGLHVWTCGPDISLPGDYLLYRDGVRSPIGGSGPQIAICSGVLHVLGEPTPGAIWYKYDDSGWIWLTSADPCP
jgi:hypothetical protein